MEKPKPWIRRWRSRDPWLWCCTTIRGMSKKNKAVLWASGNWCGTQVEIPSNILKWGNRKTSQNADSWKQEDRDESSSSTGTRKLVREVNTKKDFHNMRISNQQYLTKVFQHLQKKLGFTRGPSTFAMESIVTSVLIWGLFTSSSMKAATHLGPNYKDNLEVYKNTNFENIRNWFNTKQKLVLEHSEEILDVNTIESTSHPWTRSTLSHDQVIKWTRAKVHFESDSVLCLGKMYEHFAAIERCEGQMDEFQFLRRIIWNRWRNNWIRVAYFPRIYVIADSSGGPGWFTKEWNIEPDKFTGRIIFMSMFNDIGWTRWDLYFELRKSQEVREEILAGTLGVLRSWRREEVVWKVQKTGGKMAFRNFTDGTAIQGNRSMEIHRTQNSCSEFSFCISAQRLRSSGEWVWTIRLDRGREGTRKSEICEQKKLDKREVTRSTTFGISSENGIWKQCARKHFELRSFVQKSVLKVMWRRWAWTSCVSRDDV